MARFKERLSLSQLTGQGCWVIAAYGLAALGALAVGILQFRYGIVHLLDTVTYWSGTEATSNGRLFTTNLAPSFSNFSAIEFLERSGRLPFVDFPVGVVIRAKRVQVIQQASRLVFTRINSRQSQKPPGVVSGVHNFGLDIEL